MVGHVIARKLLRARVQACPKGLGGQETRFPRELMDFKPSDIAFLAVNNAFVSYQLQAAGCTDANSQNTTRGGAVRKRIFGRAQAPTPLRVCT